MRIFRVLFLIVFGVAVVYGFLLGIIQVMGEASGSTFTGWSGDCTNTSDDRVVSIENTQVVTAKFVKVIRNPFLPLINMN